MRSIVPRPLSTLQAHYNELKLASIAAAKERTEYEAKLASIAKV